jgi:hypothetical protein
MSRSKNYAERKSKTWIFTLNNYTQGDIEAIRLTPQINYLICGEETAELTGTPHLQGYMQFIIAKRMTTIKKIPGYGRAHLEVARGSCEDNYRYCSKNNEFFELGDRAKVSQQGLAQVDNLIDQKMSGTTDRELYDAHRAYFVHSQVKIDRTVAKLHKCDKLSRFYARYADVELRPWQKVALQLLLLQDNRQILFCYEPKGNVGKSFLADYICAHHKGFEWDYEKMADGAYAYDGEPIVVFDIPRSGHIPVGVVEKLKNGKMASPKYESTFKRFDPAKVIVFTNFRPEVGSELSIDRIQLFNIENYALTP